MALNILLLLVGFVLLIKGADFFVDGSSSIAKFFGIPGFVIGLTVVAMGTSAPEAAVSVTASVTDSNALAISNVIGSNMFNLLVVAGICAVIKPYGIEKTLLKRDLPINVALCVILPVLIYVGNKLDFTDGLFLLVGIISYVVFVVVSAFSNREEQKSDEVKVLAPWLSAIYIIGGIAAVIGGGQLVVHNATEIATALHWSETFIGLTIVAIGTSLPELVTSIVAARKGESGLALGNVIGSNIFNILFILGISSVISPITVEPSALINSLILLGVTLTIFIVCSVRKGMGRIFGGICVLGYVGYTAYLLLAAV